MGLYNALGSGYCCDWLYLPEGGYPALLTSSSPLYSADRAQECLNRCIAAFEPATYNPIRAFYLRDSDQRCACASSGCTSLCSSVSAYTSYVRPHLVSNEHNIFSRGSPPRQTQAQLWSHVGNTKRADVRWLVLGCINAALSEERLILFSRVTSLYTTPNSRILRQRRKTSSVP